MTKKRNTRRRRAPRRYKKSTGIAAKARYFKHKMTSLVPIRTGASQSGSASYHFHLQQPSGADAANSGYGFDGSARWATTYKNYEEYAVTGMKVKYIPTNTRGGISSGADSTGSLSLHGASVDPIFWWYDPDDLESYLQTESQVVASDHFNLRDPTRQFNRYMSCKKLSKMQNVAWQRTQDY